MLVDTSAWVEFLKGSEKGQKIRNILKAETCFTSIISIAELSSIGLEIGYEPAEILSKVKSLSYFLGLDENILLLAGKIKSEKRKIFKNFGLIDAIILSTAKQNGLKIISCDVHFKGEGNLIS